MYAQLLIDLFKFLAPFLRNAELSKPTQLVYKVSQCSLLARVVACTFTASVSMVTSLLCLYFSIRLPAPDRSKIFNNIVLFTSTCT